MSFKTRIDVGIKVLKMCETIKLRCTGYPKQCKECVAYFEQQKLF